MRVGPVVERLQLRDDQRDLRRRGRLPPRPAGAWPSGWRGPATCCPPGVVPAARARRAGDGPDLLVHGRGGRARPRPAPGDPGLVRPAAARVRCPAWPRSPASAGSRSSTRSNVDPDRLRAHGVTLGRGRRAPSAAAERGGRRARRSRRANAEYVVRGVGWLGRRGRATVRPRRGRPRPGGRRRPDADGRTVRARRRGHGGRRARAAARGAGEGRQRGRRRRGPDGLRREPAARSPGGSRRRSASWQPGLPPGVKIVPFYDRTPADRGGGRDGHRHGRRGDGHGRASASCWSCCTSGPRSSSPSTLPLAALASFAVDGAAAAARGSPTSRRTSCRWRGSRSRSACWSTRRS